MVMLLLVLAQALLARRPPTTRREPRSGGAAASAARRVIVPASSALLSTCTDARRGFADAAAPSTDAAASPWAAWPAAPPDPIIGLTEVRLMCGV